MYFVVRDRGDDGFSNRGRKGIFNTSLNHARAASVCHGENVAEIKIVRENDEPMFSRERHDFRIERFRIADI